MLLAQALVDVPISSNWLIGIVSTLLILLLIRNLNRIEKLLEKHDDAIQELEIEVYGKEVSKRKKQ